MWERYSNSVYILFKIVKSVFLYFVVKWTDTVIKYSFFFQVQRYIVLYNDLSQVYCLLSKICGTDGQQCHKYAGSLKA